MGEFVSKTGVDWGTSNGRFWLSVDGYVVAVEGHRCQDSDLVQKFGDRWTDESIKFVAENYSGNKPGAKEKR